MLMVVKRFIDTGLSLEETAARMDMPVGYQLSIAEPGDTGYIRFMEAAYMGLNYAAFITTRHDDVDNDNNMTYLNRVNLETFQVEEQLVSVKAAQTYLLGVLADGRVLFWYNLNPCESGICITL